jgi:penicillin-binding protein 2
MIGLEENIINTDTTIKDCVGLSIQNPYNLDDVYVFRNWRTEYGIFNLHKAIANSCNIFFYMVGGGYESFNGLGVEKISNYLKSGFADSVLGIDIPGEEFGFVPTPVQKIKNKNEPWYLGDTYNISIGQGDLLVTPLWLNAYIGAIANGGIILKPNIAKKIMSVEENELVRFEYEVLGNLPFSKSSINEVRTAMRQTVLSGTAQILKGLPVSSGAKTGTAEVIKGQTTNSLFTAFAPFDNPEVTITVLIEGTTSQQGLASRAAYQVLKWYFDR